MKTKVDAREILNFLIFMFGITFSVLGGKLVGDCIFGKSEAWVLGIVMTLSGFALLVMLPHLDKRFRP